MKFTGSRKKRLTSHGFRLLFTLSIGYSVVLLCSRSLQHPLEMEEDQMLSDALKETEYIENGRAPEIKPSSCATVEEMGADFSDESGIQSLRVRKIIRDHFLLHGAARVRDLSPEQFCKQGFVLGKASEAGFGNEMYKVLTAAALSVLLNRSLIIGQTRGKYPFGDYIAYTNLSFTLHEVKHLWRQNDCVHKHGKRLTMRMDDFEKTADTNVLCGNWREWKQPIIWFQSTTDAVAIQFFLKNIHPGMRDAASMLFGEPRLLRARPNVFGELMSIVVHPTPAIEKAVNWVLKGGPDPDITLHMRLQMNRPVRAVKAALSCLKKALDEYQNMTRRPRVVVVSDTPSLIEDIKPNLSGFAEVLHFDYMLFEKNVSSEVLDGIQNQPLKFRVKDWGPTPRWVAFVDFFLASRAKHAVVSGAHRRVGTTFAQLVAGLAAARQLDEEHTSGFSFYSSFHSNLLVTGLGTQVGWGHVWNRFSGPLSCRGQPNQCALTPLLPSAWWDATWQSPIPRDIRRMQAYGVHLSDTGEVNESHILGSCKLRKEVIKTISFSRK
ncbi:hypothetical protein AMTRI_Chr06g170280 [Amborella trichopoda]